MKNFGDVKEQLQGLSEVVNSFKSEAVQLKIVEFILGLESEDEQKIINSSPKRKTTRRKTAKKPTDETSQKRTGKKPFGQGGPATLDKLIEEGFFSEPKSIGDIVKHCEHNMARKFKANEFSGKLARLVRHGTLVRNKNSDNQYEYKNK